VKRERAKKCTCVHLREAIIAIGAVKTVFKFRVERCSPMGGAFSAKIAAWDGTLVQNWGCSLIEVLL
jgi:hypothetical protein